MNRFRKTVDILIKMMIPLVILALMMGIARIVLDLRVVFGSPTIAARESVHDHKRGLRRMGQP